MSTTDVEIHGVCAPGFEPVLRAFAKNFSDELEVGGSFAATRSGETVVDIWAGHADAARTQPWQRDTIANVYSATKGLTATCLLIAVERGLIQLDELVAHYWPEFAAAGKGDITIRQLVSHRAGLPALRDPLPSGAITDWEWMTTTLAAEEPWWSPGTRFGYHTLTLGYLVGEVLRRATGKTVGQYLRNEVADPLGLDAVIGFGPEFDDRVAELLPPPPPASDEPDALMKLLADPESVASKSFGNLAESLPPAANSREFRAAEIPSGNGHTNARSLARLYTALAHGSVDGIRLLERETIDAARTRQTSGQDAVFGLESRFGLGYMLPSKPYDFCRNPRAFGHPGMGGSLGFADPEADVAVGYTANQMRSGLTDERWAVVDVLYDCLEGTGEA